MKSKSGISTKLLVLIMFLTCLIACRNDREAEPTLTEILDLMAASESGHEFGIQAIRRSGTNIFPELLQEIDSADSLEGMARSERMGSIRILMEILGARLVLLEDQFAERIDESRNFVSAIDAFVVMGSHGVPHLEVAVTNKSPDVRFYALDAMTGARVARSAVFSGRYYPIIVSMLDDDDRGVRIRAMSALAYGCVDEESCVAILMEHALNDVSPEVRRSAIHAFRSLLSRVSLDGPLKDKVIATLDQIRRDDPVDKVRQEAESVLSFIK